MRKLKLIGGIITISTTGIILKILNEYRFIFQNRLALLQMTNNNVDYMIYKLFNDNYAIINGLVIGLGLLITYLIMRNKNNKNEKGER